MAKRNFTLDDLNEDRLTKKSKRERLEPTRKPGRPALPASVRKSRNLNIRFTKSEYTAMELESKEREETVSEFVRYCVSKEIEFSGPTDE